MTSFLAHRWGDVASVAGLIVSIWVLVVARKARQAAEEARSAARLKSLVEVLEEARNGIQQVGDLLRDQRWEEVRRLSQQVSDRCWQISARWGDQVTQGAKTNLMEAARITGSLAGVSAELSVSQLDEERLRRALESHQNASRLISIVLGEAQKFEERTKG